MTVQRVMGTETEYAVQGSSGNPVQWSFDVVAAASTPETQHIRWDYRQEDPINDMRGMRLERASVRSDMLTDEPQAQVTNVIESNGGRVYVDHAHPEYSAPETLDPFEAVRYDSAGDALMVNAMQHTDRAHPITLYRNNVDGKGASWGTHENYMMLRSVPFDLVTQLMSLHFVTRQIYTGAGRIGIGEHNETLGYQLSQRADYFHMNVGLQTTFDRPIINTRDEPHARDEFRRLHVIVGDANRMDVPRVLKLGTTSLLLWVCEHVQEADINIEDMLRALQLADPVQAMREVSHDLSLAKTLPMINGEAKSAWQIQVMLHTFVYEISAAIYGTDSAGEPLWPDRATRSVMAMWNQALLDVAAVRHASDSERLYMQSEASRLEWLFKWQIVERLRERLHPHESFEQSLHDARIASVDLRWASLDPTTSIFAKLRSQTERVCTDEEIETATHEPPTRTRAWLRGTMVQRFAPQIRAVSWTHITTVDDPHGEQWMLDMDDPRAFTQEDCSQAVEHAQTAWELIATLSKQEDD